MVSNACDAISNIEMKIIAMHYDLARISIVGTSYK